MFISFTTSRDYDGRTIKERGGEKMTKENNDDTTFMENVEKGINENIIKLSDDKSRITYFCKREYSTSFKNPEEKVRASYFVELVLDKKIS
ncbi:MAG: hypothetical protein AEth_01303 [Candidatus Argoarchaeum ethanivorans]|uniref:Uncharacterized protein n=1 Tax=Candidatus Argoarchaeum ethanivorans TaxID=2608793 RepID=A0A8B3S1I1_9EURY|nr:MAG: hypothetical protein AEth_01303 [Candidatus Argoarchaeum ethanivorans]